MSEADVRRILSSLLPDADIRTDQCDIVRVYWREICGGIRPLSDGRFHVAAGSSRTQEDNITFGMSYSETTDAEDALAAQVAREPRAQPAVEG